MLAVTCPQCGAPAPISLATPDSFRCSYCQYAGSTSPHTRAQIDAAVAALWNMQTLKRQLTSAQQSALGSSWVIWAHGGVSSLVVLILAATFLPIVLERSTPTWMWSLMLGPLTLGLLSGVLGWVLVRRRRRLQLACSASPPAWQGGPTRCHVCGGDLSAAAKGVVRCGFCHADNLVDPTVLARASRALEVVTDDYEAAVGREALAMSSAGAMASAGMIVVFVVLWLVTPLSLIALYFALLTIEQPADDSISYEIVQLDHARCFAVVDEQGEYYLGPGPGKALPTRAEGARVKATDLLGRCIVSSSGHGTIKKITTSPAELDNRAHLQTATGEATTYPITRACLCSDPEPEVVAASVPYEAPVVVGSGRIWWWAGSSVHHRDRQLAGTNYQVPGTADSQPNLLLVDERHVYTLGLQVQRHAHGGGSPLELWATEGLSIAAPTSAELMGDELAFVSDSRLHVVSKNGGDATVLAEAASGVTSLGGAWVFATGGSVLSQAGGEARALAQDAHNETPLAATDTEVFYVSKKLRLCGVTSDGVRQQYHSLSSIPERLRAAGRVVYGLHPDGTLSTKLLRYQLATNTTSRLYAGAGTITNIAVDDDHVYWTASDALYRQSHEAQLPSQLRPR